MSEDYLDKHCENTKNDVISPKISDSVRFDIDKIYKNNKEAMKPVIEAANNLNERLKDITQPFKKISDEMKPLFEIISKEYRVNKDEFNEAVDCLLSKGYFLPFYSTPMDYIRLYNHFGEENLDDIYVNLFEDDKNTSFSASDLIEMLAESPLKGWEDPLITAKEVVNENGIESTYKLILPFYYSYMESFFRFQHEDRGKSIYGFGKLVIHAKNNIKSSDEYDEETKIFFCKILDNTKKYFFKVFERPQDVTRNSVAHGYSYPSQWEKVDFYKTIALLSMFIYLYSLD